MKQILSIAALALSAIVNQLNAAPLDGTYYFWGVASKTSIFNNTSSADITGSITVNGSAVSGNATIREYGGSARTYNVISAIIGSSAITTSGPVTIDIGGTGNPMIVNPTTTSADATFTLKSVSGPTDTWVYKGRIRNCSYSYSGGGSGAIVLNMKYLMGPIFNTASSKKFNGTIYGSDMFPWM